MPGAHDEKLIAEKYALDYPRRPLATRLWKSRWNWLALFFGSLVGLVLYFVQGNAAFWSGPVSHIHASFAMDCQKCHTESWQPALRLASLDSGRHSVSDVACRKCHPTVGDHHPRLGEKEPACAACHQEHRPEVPLADVADNTCASCHGNLNSVPGAELHFAAEIVSFDAGPLGHPEFALLGGGALNKLHGALQVAHFDEASGKWIDNGGVLLNHKVHLAPEGILDSERKKVQLTCADCHEPELDGRTMKPVVYEQHCASCHPLRLADDLTVLGELPHAAPELVRGTIRERLADREAASDVLEQLPTIRRLPQPTKISDVQAKSVDALLAAADHAVFGLEAKGLCRKCHHLQIKDGAWHVPILNPEFGATDVGATREMIPTRWLSHGQFHHEKHLTVKCADCHEAAASTLTTDILLPGIANCRKCHGNNPTKVASGVVSDCVMCHDYHGPSIVPPKNVETEKLAAFFHAGDAQP